MKEGISGLVLVLLLILQVGGTWGGTDTREAGKVTEPANLLPRDGDIQGWKRSGEMFKASNDQELYRCIDGGAGLYIAHGFRSYAGQLYEGPNESVLEVAIYDQGSARNARGLYQDPMIMPDPSEGLKDLGAEARLDNSGLFHHAVEFIQDRFFVRVIIQDKSDDGLNTAIRFAHHVAARVK